MASEVEMLVAITVVVSKAISVTGSLFPLLSFRGGKVVVTSTNLVVVASERSGSTVVWRVSTVVTLGASRGILVVSNSDGSVVECSCWSGTIVGSSSFCFSTPLVDGAGQVVVGPTMVSIFATDLFVSGNSVLPSGFVSSSDVPVSGLSVTGSVCNVKCFAIIYCAWSRVMDSVRTHLMAVENSRKRPLDSSSRTGAVPPETPVF